MSERGDDDVPDAAVPVDVAALREILMKIQSMIPLVQDLDLLLRLADEDFEIVVDGDDRLEISQVKLHLLTYLLNNFARFQNTEDILDKLYGAFESLTNNITDAREAAEAAAEEAMEQNLRVNDAALGNGTRRRDTNTPGNRGGAGNMGGVAGGGFGANGLGRGTGLGRGLNLGGIPVNDPYGLGRGGLGRGGLGRGTIGGIPPIKRPSLSPHFGFSTPRSPGRLHVAAGGGDGGDPPGTARVHRLRDFKISGQIGDPGQADKLTFSNLLHQIVTGRNQRYSDEEIIAAVVKACTPGLSLRTYLEGRPYMDLNTLVTILRTHYKEKDATAVFNEMSNACQGPKDTEHSFCMRMMGLRDKVLLLTREEGNLYDDRLVQNQFQHALYTGLRDENARHVLSGILKRPNVSDEELLIAINEFMMNVAESKSKSNGGGKTSVSKVVHYKDDEGNDSNAFSSRTANKVLNKEKENTLLTQVSKTQDQIDKLTAKVSELSTIVQDNVIKAGGDESPQDFPGLGRGDRRPFFGPWGASDGFLFPPWAPWGPPPNPGPGNPPGTGRGRGRGRGGGNGRRSGLGLCPTCRTANENHCPHCFKCGETGHKKEVCPN